MSASSSQATAPPALAIHGLEKRFAPAFLGLLGQRRTVLDGVDLVLERGARLALAGPNGTGKSTLLAIAAGIDPRFTGDVRVFGESAQSMAARAHIGYVPDRAPFPGELPARALLELCGELSGLERSERKRRAARYLDRVGLGAEAKTPFRRFSQGMRRRFSLAQACQHEPDLLLLDEPTSGLDAPGFLVLDELVLEATERGATLLIASHLAGDVTRYADELAVLFGGRIAERGPAGELLPEGGEGLLGIYRRLGRPVP